MLIECTISWLNDERLLLIEQDVLDRITHDIPPDFISLKDAEGTQLIINTQLINYILV